MNSTTHNTMSAIGIMRTANVALDALKRCTPMVMQIGRMML